MSASKFNQDLCKFLNQSPTPFHAVNNLRQALQKEGFVKLDESSTWATRPGGRYLVCRNQSSLIAFVVGNQALAGNGVRMIGAHTDSPCLKVKPGAAILKQGYYQLGVEVYGGVLMNPWFDRDLGLAGRITVKTAANTVRHLLLDFHRAIAFIPSLAIHLDREVNKKRTINPQNHLLPVLMQCEKPAPDFLQLLQQQAQDQNPGMNIEEVLDYEMSFYDTQPAAIVGLQQQFLASARLDNLLSCYVGLRSLMNSEGQQSTLLVCNDHEEVGSASAAGAQGPFLRNVLQRLNDGAEEYFRCIDQSMMISVDNAHGIHPNYADKHDAQHGPILNQGPVLKINANQRYASNSETGALLRLLCKEKNVPLQTFASRNDMACGSTIGPITATELGVKTVDVGVPQFAMHSIRETAGTADCFHLYRVLSHYLNKDDLFCGSR